MKDKNLIFLPIISLILVMTVFVLTMFVARTRTDISRAGGVIKLSGFSETYTSTEGDNRYFCKAIFGNIKELYNVNITQQGYRFKACINKKVSGSVPLVKAWEEFEFAEGSSTCKRILVCQNGTVEMWNQNENGAIETGTLHSGCLKYKKSEEITLDGESVQGKRYVMTEFSYNQEKNKVEKIGKYAELVLSEQGDKILLDGQIYTKK